MNSARTILTVIAVVLLVLIVLAIFTGGGMMGGVGQMMGGPMTGGGAMGFLFMLLFWGS